MPILSILDAVIIEANGGGTQSLLFDVLLSEAAATDVFVDFQTIGGTAFQAVDFSDASGRLTIASGDTSGTITVFVASGSEIEADESFVLELTNPVGAEFASGSVSLRSAGTILDNDGTGNKLALFVDDVRVVEGDSGSRDAVFLVRLSQDPGSSVTLDFVTTDGSAVSGEDYQATSGSLTFLPGGSLVQEVRVPVFGDLSVEGSETFSLSFAPSGALANGASGSSGVATLLDDDAGGGLGPVLSVSGSEIVEADGGGTRAMEFVVTLSEASASDVEVDYQTISGSAKESIDVVRTSGTLTIAAGETSGVISISAFSASEDEADESFTLELTNVEGAVFAGDAPRLQATGTILDNDGTGSDLALFVGDAEVVEGASGTRDAVFEVRLSRPSDTTVSLSYTTRDGTARSGEDYASSVGIVTFLPGETVKAVSVAVFGDGLVEGTESFSLVFAPTAEIVSGVADSSGLGTILDDDAGSGLAPVVSLSAAEVVEADGGGTRPIDFVVRLSEAATSDVVVDYQTISGTAKEAVDVVQTLQSGQLIIAAGETSGVISISTFGASEIEADESFVLELTNVQGAVFAGDALALSSRGIILDNDSGDPVLALTVSDAEVVEGASGTREAVFEVHLSRPVDEAVTVAYTTSPGTASTGSDFEGTSGTLTFLPGQTVAAVFVPVFGDGAVEGSEIFSLALSAPQGGLFGSGGAGAQGVGVILDDDAGGGDPVISIGPAEIVEANGGGTRAIDFVVRLSAPSTDPVRVDYATLDGTAVVGEDYVAKTGTLTFAPGQTSAVVQVATSSGNIEEPDETFTLRLSNAVNGSLAGGVTELDGTGTILDNDGPAPVDGLPVLSVSDIQVEEAPGGSVATFTLVLSSPSAAAVSGSFSVEAGTASAGADFTPVSGAFLIASGDTTTTVDVAILEDGLVEPAETFVLRLTDPQNAQFAGRQPELIAIGEITDGTNQAPIAVADAFVTDEDSAFGGDVLADNGSGADSDPDGNPLTVTKVNGDAAAVGNQVVLGTGALLTLNADGTFDYDPNGQFEGLQVGQSAPDSFTYEISDGNGGTDTATVNVTVDGVSDDPVAGNDGDPDTTGYVTDEDTAFTTASVLANDTDVDAGDVLSVSGLDTTGTAGLVTDNGDGTFNYDPNGQFEGLGVGESTTDSFSYTVSDGNGGTDTAAVTVTIDGVNDDPVATDDDGIGFTTDEDTAFTTASVLPNDSDPDANDTLSVIGLDTTGTIGLVTDNGDGTFDYDPNGQFESLAVGESATDTFSYEISDGNGGTDTATVTITIDGVTDIPDNIPPVAMDDSVTTDEDTLLAGNVLSDNGSGADNDPDANPLTVTKVNGNAASVGNQIVLASGALLTLNADGTFDYDPNGQFEGLQVGQSAPDSFTYEISDGNGGTDTATVTVTIDGVNDAPDAVDDAVATDADLAFGEDDGARAITADILGNDSDPDIGDPLTVTAIDTTGTTGLATLVGGVVSYDPNGAFESLAQGTSALDTITYTISDGNGGTDTATVTVTIDGVNDDPVATDDDGIGFTTDEDTAFTTASVLPNDSDVDTGDTLSVISLDTTGTVGLVTDNGDGTFDYDPNGQFEGLDDGDSATDTFTYEISDGNGGTDTATVTITIDGVTDIPDNIPPVAMDDSVTTDEDTLLAGDVLSDNGTGADSDPDGNPLTVTKVNGDAAAVGNQVVLGTGALLTLNAGGTFDYDPNGQFEGLQVGQSAPDSFTYEISDGNGGTDTATVNVTVDGVSDDPVAGNDGDPDTTGYVTDEDTAFTTASVLANDTDVDAGDVLSVSGLDTTGTAGLVTDNGDGTFNYDPNGQFEGLGVGESTTASFSYTVSDGNGSTDTAAVTVTIDGVNDDPVATDDDGIGFTTDEDTAFTTASVLPNDSDPDANDTLSVIGLDTTGTIGLVTDNGDGTFDYDPNGQFESLQVGQSAPDSFTYEISDGNGGTDTATVTVTIDGVNDAPDAVDDAVATDADLAFGEDDGARAITADILGNDSDPDIGDPLTVTAIDTTGTTGLATLVGGVVSYDPNGAFESLAQGTSALDTITYTISDGNGGTDTATVTVTVNGVNDDPTATDDSGVGFETDEDTAFTTASVLPNDSDPDATDTLSVIGLDTTGTTGLVTDNGDGTFDYDPNGQFESLAVGESATDTFSYEISDGNGGTDTATVTITIDGVTDIPDNIPPVAMDDSVTTDEDTLLAGNVLSDNGSGADNDPDANPLTVTKVNGNAASVGNQIVLASGALLTLNADGTFDYDPNGQFEGLQVGQSAPDSFTYEISDGNGGTDTATVNVTVDGVNDAPEATDDDNNVTTQGRPIAINVLGNDTDVDSSLPDSPGILVQPSNGLVLLVDDGEVLYIPDSDFLGSDGFSYEISDSEGGTGNASVSIEVEAGPIVPFIGTDNSDLFFGTNDGEFIVGADGMDRLFGNGGDDVILGGDSTDFIFAGAGNDIVDGGGGLDLIFGGSGEDLFVVGDSDSFDLIRDFEPGVDSVLLTISDLLTSEGAIDGSLAKVVGVGSATLLQVDVGAGFQTVATLFGASGLELNDLLENHVAV